MWSIRRGARTGPGAGGVTAIEAAKSLLFWKLPPAEGEEQNQTDQEVHRIPARRPAEANGRAGRLAVLWAGGEEGGQKASGWRPLSRGPEEESEWAVPMGAGHCFVAVTVLFSSRIYIYIFFRIICASLLILSI
uniref:Uncharacterized protein n=1 Tax=Rousettus aegyptiacus TaxID=9407 RepID=A0A7J8HSM6_ROUAE|nr:hypothetical protein HJG63_010882 [Rousettus aegyptiacus]